MVTIAAFTINSCVPMLIMPMKTTNLSAYFSTIFPQSFLYFYTNTFTEFCADYSDNPVFSSWENRDLAFWVKSLRLPYSITFPFSRMRI